MQDETLFLNYINKAPRNNEMMATYEEETNRIARSVDDSWIEEVVEEFRISMIRKLTYYCDPFNGITTQNIDKKMIYHKKSVYGLIVHTFCIFVYVRSSSSVSRKSAAFCTESSTNDFLAPHFVQNTSAVLPLMKKSYSPCPSLQLQRMAFSSFISQSINLTSSETCASVIFPS